MEQYLIRLVILFNICAVIKSVVCYLNEKVIMPYHEKIRKEREAEKARELEKEREAEKARDLDEKKKKSLISQETWAAREKLRKDVEESSKLAHPCSRCCANNKPKCELLNDEEYMKLIEDLKKLDQEIEQRYSGGEFNEDFEVTHYPENEPIGAIFDGGPIITKN